VEERIAIDRESSKEKGLTVIQLKYLRAFVEGKSITEVADDFNVTEQAVREMKRKLKRKGALN